MHEAQSCPYPEQPRWFLQMSPSAVAWWFSRSYPDVSLDVGLYQRPFEAISASAAFGPQL
jgi:hypothetical protein